MIIYNIQLCYLLVLVGSILLADEVTVHNKTELPLYAALYNKEYAGPAQRFTDVKLIEPGKKEKFELPSFKTFTYREMLLSLAQGDLKEKLSEDQFLLLASQNVGVAQGYNFYVMIDPEIGNLVSYNSAEWHVVKPLAQTLRKAVTFLSKNLLGELRRSLLKDTPHDHESATVRMGTDLAPQEDQFIVARMAKVKSTIEKLLDHEISYTPRIAFCGSGGGYRAMLCTLGVLQGIQRSQMLDLFLYGAALSGSTWALASWLESGLDPDQMTKYLKPKLVQPLVDNFTRPSSFVKNLLMKYSFDQPLSLVDPYGALLGSSLLITNQGNPYILHLSTQATLLEKAQTMMPIYTAVATKLPYEWLEFTPYEVGSDYLGGYIPTWSFGRKFYYGKSVDYAPEQTLGYLMGIWGSAFTANFKEILLNLGQSLEPGFIRNALEKTLTETPIGRQRLYPAKVYNFMLGVPKTPRYQQTTLSLVDAGLDFNLPLPPLLRKGRAVDIIVVVDATDEAVVGGELKKAAEYFKRQGLNFPHIEFESISNDVCYIFRDETDQTIPVVIYLPLTKNERYQADFDPRECLSGFCNTFNFVYTAEQIDLLTGLMAYNFTESKDKIVQVIREVIQQKEKQA